MTSFQSSLRSVFGGRGAASFAGPLPFPTIWPLLKLPIPARADGLAADLAKTVASAVVPRLMQAHPTQAATESPPEDAANQDSPLGHETTETFARTLISRTPETLIAFVETMLKGGVSAAAVYADLLAPTAKLLGELWNEDLVSYTEVTIGLARLEQLIHSLGWTTPYNGEDDAAAPSALFSPRPGEQQTFGFYMMEELFRWSGWRAWIETAATTEALSAAVRTHWYDMLCLSVARDSQMEELGRTISALRRASRNQGLFVLVNGSPFTEHPERVAQIGADAAATNGADAVHVVDKAVRHAAADE